MKFKSAQLTLILLAVCLLFTSVGQSADTKGRFFLTLKDSDGKIIKGATVTLTSKVSSSKKYTLETNKKGKALIVGIDPDMYTLRVEKEGYQFLEGDIKLRAGVNVKREETMLTMEEAKEQAIQEQLDNMTEEERNAMYAGEAHNRGYEAYVAGDMETAVTEFKKAIELNPDVHYFDYLIVGQDAFNKKDFTAAQSALNKALELDIEQASLRDIGSLLGATYMMQEDTENAKKIWMMQSENAPDPMVLYNLASIEIKEDDMDGAIKWLKMSCEKFPEATDCIQLLGDVYIQKDNMPEALKAYKKLQEALQKNPEADAAVLKEVNDTVKILEETVK